MNVEGKLFLHRLSSKIQDALKRKLNRDNAWKLVANYCDIGEDFGISTTLSNPGEAFFCELCNKNYTVAELCEALTECDLPHILALFQEPAPLEIEAQPQILSKRKSSRRSHGNDLFIVEGEELRLKAQAKGIPPPKYEWHCDNISICSNWSGLLIIEKFEKKNEGRYWCKISQEQDKLKTSKITKDIVVTIDKSANKDKPKVYAKRALLIANERYDSDSLLAPTSDTSKLRDVLKEEVYGFDVTVKNDLTGAEMKEAVKEFWSDTPDNSYVIFYFAGHGFHTSNDLYFMGVDKVEAKDFGFEHAMSREEVLQKGSEHKPSLLLILCDTCQSQLQDYKYVSMNQQSPPKYDYEPYPNVIQGYATSKNGAAFEVADHRTSGGLFTNHLIEVLKSQTNLCVSETLADVRKRVSEEANRYKHVKLQVPMEVTSATTSHRLSDRITRRKKTKADISQGATDI